MRQRTPKQIAELAPACDATDFDLCETWRGIRIHRNGHRCFCSTLTRIRSESVSSSAEVIKFR